MRTKPRSDRGDFARPVALYPYLEGVSAGFPSPAGDYLEQRISLDRELIKNPASTFFCRISGNSMCGDGIADGDLVVVDKSIEPGTGKIAVCVFRGELAIKRIYWGHGRLMLKSSNPAFPDIELWEDDNLCVWGIVTYVIKTIS